MSVKGYRILTPLIMALVCAQLDAQSETDVPRLVVNVTIDRFRTDYMEAFSSLYGEDGFQRLLKEGCVCMEGEYPFVNVDRASAVACVMTGTVPYDNGIVGERWMDRKTLRPMYCLEDPNVEGWMTYSKYAPSHLNVSTITDELKVATGGRALVYSIAPEPDAAVLGAGHAADGAFWIDDASGQWCGTSYYGECPDWALSDEKVSALPKRISDAVWVPLSPIVGTSNPFVALQDGKSFKHKFSGDRKYKLFKTSANVNDEVNQMVRHCLAYGSLGEDRIPDFLSISYYAGNYDHASMGECPIEQQDIYVRLDQDLGELIAILEEKVGEGNYLLAITSTGCADVEMTDLSSYRIPTGTFNLTRASSLLNLYLSAVYGAGQYVETEFDTQLFLNPKLIEDKQLNMSDVLTRCEAFLIQMEGVRDVFTSQRLALASGMPGVSRLRNSFNQSRSGDIFIEVSPGWKVLNEETHEESLKRASYVSFPIFFFGNHVHAEVVRTPVSVDRIAPTLARFMRIRAPNACSVAPLSAVK